jgi:hypothetical protein
MIKGVSHEIWTLYNTEVLQMIKGVSHEIYTQGRGFLHFTGSLFLFQPSHTKPHLLHQSHNKTIPWESDFLPCEM